MIETLKRFTQESLFEASSNLLNKLNIGFERETAEPINVADIYDGPMPQYLIEALKLIKDTFFIGVANDLLLSGSASSASLGEISDRIDNGAKYDGMFVFACDVKDEKTLSRSQATALTRALNRISYANPVILVIRERDKISLATCERQNYTQEWRRGTGEKLGKVSILRNVNCVHPHRGHVDILDTLTSKVCKTFDALYQHWMDVFSSELLTKKFYNELSDWYAWAVQVAKFPNNLASNEDDAKYNHEACIRLITRLIFVWFLKQKHLIPEEFFDEKYIRENLIENFDPHDKQSLYYDAGKSKYYRLILQNLFFAMLNCPIVAEGKTIPNNRRFRGDAQSGTGRNGFNMNNLMRYKSEFAEKGADKFVKLANASVPFLNGGLFDCLDDKPRGLYYDGFSENEKSLAQLFLPDYLFFGEEVGAGIDLSQWYDDDTKRNVSARGIIDILKRYSFTIEENTPYDQEVSLDPELLGKVFENLLAAYNPETKQSARKETGSFYTPREIVQHMVDESLVAHLNRLCGKEQEQQYRDLLSYGADNPMLSNEQCKSIMHALYNCRVLDPACGSGAFPMGVLQQMVHVLKRIDPTNEMWNSMMVDIAIEDARKELQKVVSGNEAQILEIEEKRKARLDDIESAFNQNINDPDYARKLYLIEHCIYGVDIQPIATQISKLRFFISLVVDQKPTSDAKSNFGIRPLPNLEAKFVTANTLIPLDRAENLFTNTEEIRYYEEELQEANHRMFLAKKNSEKIELQNLMFSLRAAMAQTMENMGAIGTNGYNQLMGWNMFDQNASSGFFDPEWMFGIKDEFDIVIANPPYVNVKRGIDPGLKDQYEKIFKTAVDQYDLFEFFIELGLKLGSINCMIVPKPILNNKSYAVVRSMLLDNNLEGIITGSNIFENAGVESCIFLTNRAGSANKVKISRFEDGTFTKVSEISDDVYKTSSLNVISTEIYEGEVELLKKLNANGRFEDLFSVKRGVEAGKKDDSILDYDNGYPLLRGQDVAMYTITHADKYIDFDNTDTSKFKELSLYTNPKILLRRVGNNIQCVYDANSYIVLNTVYCVTFKQGISDSLEAYSAILNSKLVGYWFLKTFCNTDKLFPYIRVVQLNKIPLPILTQKAKDKLKQYALSAINNLDDTLMSAIDLIVYKLYGLTYAEVLIIDPDINCSRQDYDTYTI